MVLESWVPARSDLFRSYLILPYISSIWLSVFLFFGVNYFSILFAPFQHSSDETIVCIKLCSLNISLNWKWCYSNWGRDTLYIRHCYINDNCTRLYSIFGTIHLEASMLLVWNSRRLLRVFHCWCYFYILVNSFQESLFVCQVYSVATRYFY